MEFRVSRGCMCREAEAETITVSPHTRLGAVVSTDMTSEERQRETEGVPEDMQTHQSTVVVVVCGLVHASFWFSIFQ